MNQRTHRRDFLADVGRGMIVAGIGLGTAVDLGLASARAGDDSDRLSFGDLEPLVAFMQETSADRIIPETIAKLRSGVELKTLLAASALANARTFGGEDYIGFHTMMAHAPAMHMANELAGERAAMPVLKVIRRNTGRIQETGGNGHEVLHPVQPGGTPNAEALRAAVRGKDLDEAERIFAAIAAQGPDDAFNDVLVAVQDNTEVHRVVMPYRAWDLMGLIGREHAHTLLRQSVHYCVKSERQPHHNAELDRPRVILPKLLEEYGLLGKQPGTKPADDAWVEHLSRTIFEGSPDSAAEAAAAALAEGFAPDAVGEAITMAANTLVLRDPGRSKREAQPGKPEGSVHGDSIGVHACDSANAWRNMARMASTRNVYACLILGAFQAAYDRQGRGGDFLHWQPYPLAEHLDSLKTSDPRAILSETETAIQSNDQARACALVHRYGELGHKARPVFDLMLRYAVSEDGALHAEKYYRTVSEEFAAARPAFRWRQLAALARVTASEFGKKAAGYEDARQLLGV